MTLTRSHRQLKLVLELGKVLHLLYLLYQIVFCHGREWNVVRGKGK